MEASVRHQRRRLVEAGQRLLGPAELLQQRAAVDPVGDRLRVERQRLVERRQRLRRTPEFAQHLGAVAVGLGEIDVAFERVVEGGRGLLRLAQPVQRLADEIVRARLPPVEGERAGGQIDALLKLPLLAGDHGDVIERLGVLRVVAQHLGVAVHGGLDVALAVVEQALLEKLLGGSRVRS